MNSKSVNNTEMFDCEQCEKTFPDATRLQDHKMFHRRALRSSTRNQEIMQLDSIPELFQCDHCDKQFKNEKALKLHKAYYMKQSDKKKDHQQKQKEFSEETLKFHKTTNSEVPSLQSKNAETFSCDQCEKTFPDATRLQDHKMFHRRALRSSTKSQTIVQLELNSISESFECDHCDKQFKNEKALKVHKAYYIKQSDNNKGNKQMQYECSDCKELFASEKSLKLHKITHSEVPALAKEKKAHEQKGQECTLQRENIATFNCDKCEKTFSDENGLRDHKMFHRRALRSSTLNQTIAQLELVSIPESFDCDHCEKSFKNEKALKIHKAYYAKRNDNSEETSKFHKTTRSEVPLLASDNKKAEQVVSLKPPKNVYFSPSTLQRENARTFDCDKCEKTFSDENGLRDHKMFHRRALRTSTINQRVDQ